MLNGIACAIGSLPHTDADEAVDFILSEYGGIPFWPQLPKRDFLEGFYVQYAEGLPSCVIDREKGKIFFDTESRMDELADFYERFMAEDWQSFAITERHALGLHTLLKRLEGKRLPIIKGHVTGPVTFPLSVSDHNEKLLAYDENYYDMTAKGMLAKGQWQIDILSPLAEQVIIFYDEPALVGFGSAFVQLTREQIVEKLNVAVAELQARGAQVGIHCCANTDWSLILDSGADILSFDAYSFFENLLIYSTELQRFFDRGGQLAFGIIPTNEKVFDLRPSELTEKLIQQVDTLSKLGIDREQICKQSLITPACGLGTTEEPLAARALQLTTEVSKIFRDRFKLD